MRRLWALLLERFTLGVLTAVAALALFILVAYGVAAGMTRRTDLEAVAFFQARQTPLAYMLMQGISLLAGGGAQATVAAGCLLSIWRRPRIRPLALTLLIALGGGECLVYGLKALFHRPRPAEAFAGLGYSFPSGHSFTAVTLYGLAAHWLAHPAGCPKRHWVWPVAVLLILLIGFSRVFLGVHYPSDVCAGFAVAVPWLWACLALPKAFRSIQRHRCGAEESL